MAGEIFYMLKASEAKQFEKEPERIWKMDRQEVPHVDVGLKGFELDAALSDLYPSDSVMARAIAGGKDIGNRSCHIRYLAPARVKEIAAEIGRVETDELHNAFCRMNASGDEGFESCRECFKDLVELFQEAARKKLGIVKTIY